MRKSSAPSRKHAADESVSSTSLKVVQTAALSGSNVKLRRFDVTYAKASTRKHKSYTDDGILEIQGLKATLKDNYGRVSSVPSQICWLPRLLFAIHSTSPQLVSSIPSSSDQQFRSVATSFWWLMKYLVSLPASDSKQIQLQVQCFSRSSPQFTAKHRKKSTKISQATERWRLMVASSSWRTSAVM